MAVDKEAGGKPDGNGGADSSVGKAKIAAFAVNRANAPREWKIRGSWKKWEPSGREGDAVGLTREELDSSDFASVAKHFSVRMVKA